MIIIKYSDISLEKGECQHDMALTLNVRLQIMKRLERQ